ncbi:uncharacterized protein BO97DRAFT_287418 [Aspergillus homomorphus CBS 101889]|uniref:Arrestin-like N-terminal domain-containing protein n=1 Tax=Aspergillus homomorphus (strain CBS 101889) TaxID=1450537 RepID=A0A395HGD2_ASPHC|nr:hypothetical protein BO97DRAFT_287418 [Aspergillus homomorphus CBS 101889]RAL06696.1 hypothetical protein BO97DRAFT_287418 [Aspergillus homomorphus CBS 101889]
MPLIIHLDNQQRWYSGGETISGHVEFQCAQATEVDDIRVSFFGRSKAKVQKVKGSAAPSASYRSKCVLFDKERILSHLNGDTLSPGTYEWPFVFTFPSNVQSPGQSSGWTEKSPFRNDVNHPLPPSFAVDTGDTLRKLNCAIEYQLEAEVFKSQRGFLGKKLALFKETLHLRFVPPAPSAEKACDSVIYRQQRAEMFEIRSILLLLENRGRSLTFQERLQSWVSARQPRFSFKATFSYPIRVKQGSSLTCLLEIHPFMEDSSVSLPPEISLQSLSLCVVSQTAARAAPSLIGSLSGQVHERIELLNQRSLAMPVMGTLDLSHTLGPLRLSRSDISFSTFNLSRSYLLCASFAFECAGKSVEFSLADMPFEMVADVQATSGSKDIAENSAQGAPPSYHASNSSTEDGKKNRERLNERSVGWF